MVLYFCVRIRAGGDSTPRARAAARQQPPNISLSFLIKRKGCGVSRQKVERKFWGCFCLTIPPKPLHKPLFRVRGLFRAFFGLASTRGALVYKPRGISRDAHTPPPHTGRSHSFAWPARWCSCSLDDFVGVCSFKGSRFARAKVYVLAPPTLARHRSFAPCSQKKTARPCEPSGLSRSRLGQAGCQPYFSWSSTAGETPLMNTVSPKPHRSRNVLTAATKVSNGVSYSRPSSVKPNTR